ncbi:hypothetical protein GGR57DRAFT_254937 [Xylariaceae sp. FL1272]|nr:hypothetical protein GGR57DRAFT_254937 [Xylariaceae sp. FL1272]
MLLRNLSTAQLLLSGTMALGEIKVDEAGPVRRGDSREEKELYVRADATSGASPTTTTPYAVALTTTFIPPDTCNQGQLTMLSSPGFFIWLNEPIPVPEKTISDCYPTEFMQYYTTYRSDATFVGSRVPLMSPLVCPFGWQVASQSADYQACCPDGYELTPPETTLDPNRPAYGGTCFSQWPSSSTAHVIAYGPSKETGTILVQSTLSGFANYAHVIDGIAMKTASSDSSTKTTSSDSSISSQTNAADSSSNTLSSGAVAGIVVALVVVVLGIISFAAFLFLRRRRQRLADASQPPLPPPKDELATYEASSPTDYSRHSLPMYSPPVIMNDPVEMASDSHVYEMDSNNIYMPDQRHVPADATPHHVSRVPESPLTPVVSP